MGFVLHIIHRQHIQCYDENKQQRGGTVAEDSENSTHKKLIVRRSLVAVLLFCFGITSYAFSGYSMAVRQNVFTTGAIDINLNNGCAAIDQKEFNLEPGMTIVKSFFLENSGQAAYYRIYFENIKGSLRQMVKVTLKEGADVLYSGTAADFTLRNAETAPNRIATGEKRWLQISFHLPYSCGNSAQGQTLSFVLTARAVQVKNNTDKTFG